MATVWVGVGVAVLAFVFGVAGLYLQKLLPETHSVEKARDMIGAIVGLVSLLLALVLGTLIGSAYAFYATEKSEIETMAAKSVQLDLALAEFGPETAPARARMKETLQSVRDMVWGDSSGASAMPDFSVSAPIQHLREMDEYVASLDPKTPAQRQFASAAAADTSAIEQTRLLISMQLASAISWPLVVIVVSWALILFCGFRPAFSRQRHHARRCGPGRFCGRQRIVPDPRTEPSLYRIFPGALRRLRPDAEGLEQVGAR